MTAAVRTRPAWARSGKEQIASIRYALRAIAVEGDLREGLNRVKLLRPLVTQAQDALRKRFEASGAIDDYQHGRTRLADSAVMGLLHVASISSGIRDGSMAAPIAAIALGEYGRKELGPNASLTLLFLLPESNRSPGRDVARSTRACIGAVVTGLWDLGFLLDHVARSAKECLELAECEPAVLSGLLDRRFLWGGFGLFTSLDVALSARFSGPKEGRSRENA